MDFFEVLQVEIAPRIPCLSAFRPATICLGSERRLSPSTDLQELVSILLLELLDRRLATEDVVDDTEDQSLIELAGETLEEILVDFR